MLPSPSKQAPKTAPGGKALQRQGRSTVRKPMITSNKLIAVLNMFADERQAHAAANILRQGAANSNQLVADFITNGLGPSVRNYKGCRITKTGSGDAIITNAYDCRIVVAGSGSITITNAHDCRLIVAGNGNLNVTHAHNCKKAA